jgi:hypothetical protein
LDPKNDSYRVRAAESADWSGAIVSANYSRASLDAVAAGADIVVLQEFVPDEYVILLANMSATTSKSSE